MYENFYGLRERPFDLTPNPRFLVLTESHREALSNLEYAIASRKGITLLVGEAGSGKTTVIRAALEQQVSQTHCVHLTNPALTREEFVEMLAARFDLSAAARTSKAALLLELEELLQRRYREGERTLLVIDEAQSLSCELLEEVRLLANLQLDDGGGLLSLIIAGQPELSDQLNRDSLRQLKQRVALRCELRPLTLPETLAYVAGRIRAAGGVGARLFSREAVALIHEHALGIPRSINVLADNVLISGFAHGKAPVTTDLVKEVAAEFHFGPSAGTGFVSEKPSRTAFHSGTTASSPRTIAPLSVVPAEAGGQGALAHRVADAPSEESADGGAIPPRDRMFSGIAGRRWPFGFLARKGVA
jgi:general secretion pathway protein A